jgi:hypothetical protein
MKSTLLLATLMLTFGLSPVQANPNRGSFVLETESPQQIDVYNDGRNTYIKAAPGLVINGATSDGDRYIVKGTPREIQGFISGRPVTITQESARLKTAAARQSSSSDIASRIEQLQQRENALLAKNAAGAASTNADANCPFVIRQEDGKLSDILERWAKRAGYQMSWEIKGEEPVISMNASYCDKPFLEALEEVLASYEEVSPMQAVVWRRNNAIQILTGSR